MTNNPTILEFIGTISDELNSNNRIEEEVLSVIKSQILCKKPNENVVSDVVNELDKILIVEN